MLLCLGQASKHKEVYVFVGVHSRGALAQSRHDNPKLVTMVTRLMQSDPPAATSVSVPQSVPQQWNRFMTPLDQHYPAVSSPS